MGNTVAEKGKSDSNKYPESVADLPADVQASIDAHCTGVNAWQG